MEFFLLKNAKMPTIVGILTFMSRKNSILSEPENAEFLDIFHTYQHLKFHNFMLSWVEHEIFYNVGADWQHLEEEESTP